ncbi:3-dehydroquinate synthase [Demequina sp. B12]|uniref:3-dehydroquinate synthase n=1 Tax=Demequina sp. B12 TaxID=2992757 RepID=UPI00237AB128|nr:3-dehydroquinate synthase [Demequina sp. B12]MDE0573052.1 3-dehydroquinate synthase [Demequina sp. B12]
MTTTVHVGTSQPYNVHIGHNLIDPVVESLPGAATRVAIIHSAPMAQRADALRGRVEASGRQGVLIEVPDAEAGKTAEVAAFCWQVLGKSDFTRTDVVVGLGGGAVTDLAGFVAASWLRGVAVIQMPTTVLGMVDAAVGGKTGINTTEGKNLVGAFHEPLGVWCDLDTLATLPVYDRVAGLAEVVKGGFIADATILELAQAHASALRAEELSDDGLDVLQTLIARKIQVKATVVAADLKESYLREILNYGHTFGHAIEYTERYQWRHGAAVSVGMVYEAELARLAGKLDDAAVDLHREILGGLGLPTTYPGGRWDALHTAMKRDKKTRGDLLRFVILQGIGNPVRLEGPDPALLLGAYDAVSSDSLL